VKQQRHNVCDVVVSPRQPSFPDAGDYTGMRIPAALVLAVVALALAGCGHGRADAGASQPSPVAEMLMTSDDDVADTLWMRYGNVAIIYRAVDRIGLPDVIAPEDSGRWGDTGSPPTTWSGSTGTCSPKDVSVTIPKALGSTTRQAADNFYQHYGIVNALDGHDWKVKQGWACRKPDRVLHSTGIVGRYIVAALSAHDAATSTWDQVGTELTEAVRRPGCTRAEQCSGHPCEQTSDLYAAHLGRSA
jgi:hypothetical protein